MMKSTGSEQPVNLNEILEEFATLMIVCPRCLDQKNGRPIYLYETSFDVCCGVCEYRFHVARVRNPDNCSS
jgi:hypothetical protein